MSKFIIVGGKKPKGKIKISGSKNAALALIPATLLIEGKVRLLNIPRINDVLIMLDILKSLGGEYQWLNEHELLIDTRHIAYAPLINELIMKLRGSILFLGPILGKFKKCEIAFPGGDIIGARPIKTHLKALNDLGAEISINKIIEAKIKKLTSTRVIFDEISVTASELLLLFAANFEKTIELRLVAIEPHVVALEKFLVKAGFSINGIGTHFIRIKKNKKIKKNLDYVLPPDDIEAGTFIALGAATKGNLLIENISPENMDSIFQVMKSMNIKFEIKDNNLKIQAFYLKGAKIQTGLYPKFPTDLQPPFGVLATQADGVTLIHDWMYENRFGYLNELRYMGANIDILDPHRAIIIGPTPLMGTEVKSLDIRSGIALVIAGCVAQGKTIIYEAEKIDRGYENIDKRLQNLGLMIERIED